MIALYPIHFVPLGENHLEVLKIVLKIGRISLAVLCDEYDLITTVSEP